MNEVISDAPHVIVLAGPNGAGKSTAAARLLPQTLAIEEFVNADVIAQGLSAFAPEAVAIEAGRIMLKRLRQLAADRKNFAFETTLATRSFARWLAELTTTGYRFELLYFYLHDPQLAVERVALRVRHGGHHVPSDVIVRRYERGLWNLFNLYIPLATQWHIYDNGKGGDSSLIAAGSRLDVNVVANAPLWNALKEKYSHEPKDEA